MDWLATHINMNKSIISIFKFFPSQRRSLCLHPAPPEGQGGGRVWERDYFYLRILRCRSVQLGPFFTSWTRSLAIPSTCVPAPLPFLGDSSESELWNCSALWFWISSGDIKETSAETCLWIFELWFKGFVLHCVFDSGTAASLIVVVEKAGGVWWKHRLILLKKKRNHVRFDFCSCAL